MAEPPNNDLTVKIRSILNQLDSLQTSLMRANDLISETEVHSESLLEESKTLRKEIEILKAAKESVAEHEKLLATCETKLDNYVRNLEEYSPSRQRRDPSRENALIVSPQGPRTPSWVWPLLFLLALVAIISGAFLFMHLYS